MPQLSSIKNNISNNTFPRPSVGASGSWTPDRNAIIKNETTEANKKVDQFYDNLGSSIKGRLQSAGGYIGQKFNDLFGTKSVPQTQSQSELVKSQIPNTSSSISGSTRNNQITTPQNKPSESPLIPLNSTIQPPYSTTYSSGQTRTDPATGLVVGNFGGTGDKPAVNINDQNALNDQNAMSAFAKNGGVNPNGQSPATSYQGLVSSIANSANQNPSIGQSAKEIMARYGKAIADTGTIGSAQTIGERSTPFGEGNARATENATSQRLSALGAAEQAELQGIGQQLNAQGQQTSGLQGAAGLIPEALRYGGTESGSVMGNSIDNAVNTIRLGGTTQDAMSSIIGGDVGKNAFINKMRQFDHNWNPTASNAIAIQNMTQGSQSQGQANEMSKNIQQLDNVSKLANDFLSKNNFLNPSSNKTINDSVNTYIDTFAPSVKGNYEQTMGDIAKFQSAILASDRGGIPTDVSNAMKSFDPHNLSAPALKDYLRYLKLLGDNQLSVLQDNTKANYGSSGAYTGNQTGVNTTSPETTAPLNIDLVKDPIGRAVFGGILNIIKDVPSAVKSVAQHASLLLE